MSTQEGIDRFIAKTEERLGRTLDELERTVIAQAYCQAVEDTILDCVGGAAKTLGDELDPTNIH